MGVPIGRAGVWPYTGEALLLRESMASGPALITSIIYGIISILAPTSLWYSDA